VKLLKALELLARPVSDGAPEFKLFLACGFTPLHLQTFLRAELLTLLPDHCVSIETGLYGDLIGNLERLDASRVGSVAVMIEWGDLDPRLSIRNLGGWRTASLPDVMRCLSLAIARLQKALSEISGKVLTVVCMPTLPLPPLPSTQPVQASSFEIRLREVLTSFAAALAERPGIRVVNLQYLDEASPHAGRFDVNSEIATGFPYSLGHAAILGEVFCRLVYPTSPKKGLITDLDDTLWAGILGEDGPQGISWDLEHHTHGHGLYQQFLAALASAGVLIGVASKNDSSVVETVLDREDLLISKSDIFPFEIHWSRKSESVRRILETWNISADSVVFIDDSPSEVAEVRTAFPELECIVFPTRNDRAIWDLMRYLRGVFGKPLLTEEDILRVSSIRTANVWRNLALSESASSDEFLASAEASVVFEFGRKIEDARAFQLLNKTNQFNLNGKRLSDLEWRNCLAERNAFLLTASYRDKYAPLGKVAALLGNCDGKRVFVNAWVLSCRAFSRRIEHQCLTYLFETLGAEEIIFQYEATTRNGPLQDFLRELLGERPGPRVRLSKELFARNSPPLFHMITTVANV
jgi:FkbH-like protein